jgi:hypothetical protein
MLWLTWRQFRAQGIVAGAALAVLAITLAVTGPHLAGLYSSSGLSDCTSGCNALASSFINQVKGSGTELIFYGGIFLLYLAPALAGIFWGAPLLTREIESGTFRLAWNQSVTRARWIAVKLGLVGLAAMIMAGLLSLMINWWASPLYQAARQSGSNALSINRLAPPLFGATGTVPVGYAAFAFALGVMAGVLIRRLLPAMAVTLIVFAAAQFLMPAFVRPALLSPATSIQALGTVNFYGTGDYDNGILLLQVGSVSGHAGDWILSSHPVGAAGQAITRAPAACMSADTDFMQCLASNGVRMAISYQPASRYWDFQWLETGVFLMLAAGLGGACYWRVRRLA